MPSLITMHTCLCVLLVGVAPPRPREAVKAFTVASPSNDCFGSQKDCPYFRLSLLQDTAAVILQ